MGYVRAEDILPQELISLIQQYADGVTIYVPRKSGERIGWGERNRAKQNLLERDRMIWKEFCSGLSVKELAERHYLSQKSIQRILQKMKNG